MKKILTLAITFLLLSSASLAFISIPQVKTEKGSTQEFWVPLIFSKGWSGDFGHSVNVYEIEDSDYFVEKGSLSNPEIGTHIVVTKGSIMARYFWINNDFGAWDDDVLSYTILPSSKLGTEYLIPVGGTVSVVATQPSTTVNYKGSTSSRILLEPGDNFQFTSPEGSWVKADKPIAVAVGNIDIKTKSDTFAYAPLPNNLIGTRYHFSKREPMDSYFTDQAEFSKLVIMATDQGATVSINGIAQPSLPAYGFMAIENPSGNVIITSDKPVSVVYLQKIRYKDPWTGDTRYASYAYSLIPKTLWGTKYIVTEGRTHLIAEETVEVQIGENPTQQYSAGVYDIGFLTTTSTISSDKSINLVQISIATWAGKYFPRGDGLEVFPTEFFKPYLPQKVNPTVTLTSDYQLGVAGSTLTYTVSIKNNDPLELGPSTFSLTYSIPSGWSASLSKTSVTLNPGETDSSIILSVTSATNALIGRYQLSITARDLAVANRASTGYATYAVASSVSVELFSASIKALDSQKEGVLEASTIVDNNIPNLPLTLLKDSIAFIPLPIPAEGMTKSLVDMVIKNAIGVTLDQITPDMKGNLHEIYIKGGLSEDIEKAKMNILELFTNEKMLNLQESPFVQDVLTYFRYIEELGSDYKSQVQSLVDAHNSQKVLKTISFCAAGLLIIISGPAFGLSAPAIMILEVGKAGIETSVDLVSESNYQKSLVSTSEQQLSNAYYFKERIISALTYVKDKMPGTFPHVSISGNINLFNGDIDLTIKNEFKANLKLKVMVEAEAFIPELIYREQTYVVPRISYGYTSEDIYLSDNAEKQIHIEAKIESWLNDVTSKLGGQKVSISFFACVRTFYGEDEILALHQELFSAKRFLELLGKPPLWQTQGSGTIVMLNEWEHKLYLHLYDQYGRHVGFNRSTKEIDLEIPQATYEDLNNRIIITLPTEVTFFTYEVDAVDAELATEGYNLNISYIVNGATLSYFAKNATIDKGSVYESSVAISPDGRKIWVNVPQWSTKLNQYLWTIPVIGELVKFFDSMSNGYGSLLLILTIVGIITVATVVTWRIKLKHKKS